MDRLSNDESEGGFRPYAEGLAGAIGHAGHRSGHISGSRRVLRDVEA